MDLKTDEEVEFYEIAKEIIEAEIYQILKQHSHHGKVTVYDHCLKVAKRCYLRAKKKKLDIISAIRGALLHDFYFYDWHDKNKGFRWHGYKHARISLENAKKHFVINKLEENMILSHMWPLNLWSWPKYKESWVLVISDKICTFKDYFEKKRG